ncbi:armadillo repeat-containing protein 5 [Latimeria chalumnae]|uniref:armadillo repeat-containing protein 5 n=1 Tax=Latimeria chalumnae TaxID=7897 RepID=UPI0003C12F4B|nr:PREDICTED: armadillo repeat-containing protein 5 [Latimeria chalumnae]|eukprot:XP_006000911.1 PREDICTED: armadillo repeat-containing protein 5 [Latimeria chalumnae]
MALERAGSDSLSRCLRELAGPGEPAALTRCLIALRTEHLKAAGGLARFRARGGLRPLLALLHRPRAGKNLDLALSILANCCTERESRAQVRLLGGIPPLVTILKSISVESILNRASRALGNLAIDRENSSIIHEAGTIPHLVQILKTTKESECLQSVIRALRNLSETPAHRQAILQQHALKPLVEQLGSEHSAVVAASVRAVAELTRNCSFDCAEQLSLNGGVPKLVLLARSEKKPIHQGALSALSNICAQGLIRPTVGNAGGIPCFVEEIKRSQLVQLCQPYVRALCLCCREAINRVRVRESGALELLLSLLKDPRFCSCYFRIISAFLHFFYDENALDFLQSNGLVPLLVSLLVGLARRLGERCPAPMLNQEEEEEDERYAASCDFPTEYNRRTEPELPGGEVSSFQSFRSWLLSEGYIASPGDLSPQWSPGIGALDLEAVDGEASAHSCSAALGLQKESPVVTSSDSSLRGLAGNSEQVGKESQEECPMDNCTESFHEIEVSVGGVGHDLVSDVLPADLEEEPPSTSSLQASLIQEIRRAESGEWQGGPSPEIRALPLCRRKRVKSRSVPGLTEGTWAACTEASTSTPIVCRSTERASTESILGDTMSSPVQEILLGSEMISSINSSRQEETWGPEAAILLLLSRFSEVADPSGSLVTERTLQGLLDYLTLAVNPSPRCACLLKRLTCNPNCLEAFLRLHGPSVFRMRLIHGVCPLALKESAQQDRSLAGEMEGASEVEFLQKINDSLSLGRNREIGEVLIRNLSVQAESPFGIGTLNHMLLSGSEPDRLACALALPLICRNEALCRKLLFDQGGLRLILEALATSADLLFVFCATDSILTLLGPLQDSAETHAMPEIPVTAPDTSPNLSQPVKQARTDTAAVGSGAGCPYEQAAEAGRMDVRFELDGGDTVAAHRAQLSASSDVFCAMLEGDYLESQQTVVPIRDVPSRVFTTIIHFLHGCRRSCCPTLGNLELVSPEEDLERGYLGQTLSVASRFLLSDMQHFLQDLVFQHYLGVENLAEVYLFSERHHQVRLKRLCLRYLLRGSHEISERSKALHCLARMAAEKSAVVSTLHSLVVESV